MRRLIGGAAVILLATVPLHSAASDLTLTLVLYNHAHVGDETLAQAEKTASEILKRAGVRLVWLEGFAYAAERGRAEIPAPEYPATLVVKLQPASEAARYGVRSTCEGIGFESGAIVFVRRLNPSSTPTADAIHLGYVIAHELGHILLGPDAHSIVGIMRRTFLQQDWENAAQGTLGFTRSQQKQIQRWILERSRR
jgi:hypothetical protein